MRQKPINPKHRGCLNCPPPRAALKMNRRIGVGFGIADVTRNGKQIWCEKYTMKWEQLWTVQKAENRARKQRGDWRIRLHGPLHGETYQRQGRNKWVCIESNHGFA